MVRAAIGAADPGRLVEHAVATPATVARLHAAHAVDVLAVGKASAAMLAAFTAASPVATRATLSIGVDDAGHPVPDERSVVAARRALEMAASVGANELLVVLLSGGASAMMALPAHGITLDDKRGTVRQLLAAGADITDLNTVRKHLSAIKGGQLAAACGGSTLTLAISDVVGDDLAVIGSGPTVPDPSTWTMAMDVLEGHGGGERYPTGVVALLERGSRGGVPETPKPGDPRLARSVARVIGGRRDALRGARQAARSLGYHVHVIDAPVTGEARAAARAHVEAIAALLPSLERPACILSAGETTVRVTGTGRGGRNQEFALAMATELAALGARIAVASVGTDGIDGPTDAAGAIVDGTTPARAAAVGLAAQAFLDNNDSYSFFEAIDDLIRLGPTGTNVGDLQVVLIGE